MSGDGDGDDEPGDPVLTCPYCGAEYTDPDALVDHADDDHNAFATDPRDPNDPDAVRCARCHRRFDDPDALVEHRIADHDDFRAGTHPAFDDEGDV